MNYLDTFDQKIIFDEIKENGLLIGSRAWGVETPVSDWDFIMPRREFRSIRKKLNKTYTEGGLFKNTLNFNLCGEKIQMWPEDARGIKIIDRVNIAIKHIAIDPAMKKALRNKNDRIKLFELLCDINDWDLGINKNPNHYDLNS